MDFFRKIKGYLVLLLLPALLLLMGNAAFNWHVHQLDDGTKIVHAHPFHKSGTPTHPTSNHHHSSSEYGFIQQLTGFIFILAQVILFALLCGIITHTKGGYRFRLKPSTQLLLLPNRAPPAL